MARDKTREELADEVENLRRRMAELEAGKTAQQVDLLRSILDSIGEGVIVTDKDGKFLVFNPTARRILGVGPTEDPPEKWPQFYKVFLPDKVTPFAVDELPSVRAMRGEAVDEVESFRHTPNEPDGIFVSTSARPLKDEQDKVQGSVVVVRDITRHKRLQEELQAHRNRLQQLVDERTTELQAANNRLRKEIIERERAEEAREESQHFAQGIADALPNMIYVYDSVEHRNVYTNDRISRILGYPPEQARRIESNLQAFVHPDDYPAVCAYLERLAQGGDEEVHEVEYRMCHADGAAGAGSTAAAWSLRARQTEP